IALWDVLSSCDINGASDASIKNAMPNDFTEILSNSKITKVFCTGKTAYNLWNKFCKEKYEVQFNLTTECLPSTSPANAAWSFERLVEIYRKIAESF
ncbi:MAG: DNA-deoxyinosine glycosylase, partial [Treponema sp.]|nr:DNA-deoxyinosine glycosylase [Treponema sp.]